MVGRVESALGGSLQGKRVGVLGLNFKPNTDDMRDAPSIPLVHGLVERGASVVAFDPVLREQAAPLLPAIDFAAHPEDVADGADAVVVIAEWDEFCGLSLSDLVLRMRGNALAKSRSIAIATSSGRESAAGRRSARDMSRTSTRSTRSSSTTFSTSNISRRGSTC